MAEMKEMMTKTGIKDVTVKCKNCGRSAKASEFVLDHVHRMMVCPLCIKERTLRDAVHKEIKAKRDEFKKVMKAPVEIDERKKNIPGWDKDDELLERAQKFKLQGAVNVQRLDSETVKYRCPKCNYVFKINTVARNPNKCQYCGAPISKFR